MPKETQNQVSPSTGQPQNTEEQSPRKLDLFSAMMDSGYTPDQILQSVPDGFDLSLGSAESYKDKYGDKFKTEEEFNDFHTLAGEAVNVYNNNKASYGNFALSGAETHGVGIGRSDFGKSGNKIVYKETDPVFESFISAKTGKYESYFSRPEQATLRNFYVDETLQSTTGDKIVPTSPTYAERQSKNFLLKTDSEGKPYWALSDASNPSYEYQKANAWGDPEKYANGIMDRAIDAIGGFATSAAVETVQLIPQLMIMGADVLGREDTSKDELEQQRKASGYDKLTSFVNTLERYKYVPSEEVQNGSVFDMGASTLYSFGQGLGYLLPQRWAASGASALTKGLSQTTYKGVRQAMYKGIFKKALDGAVGEAIAKKFVGSEVRSIQQVAAMRTAMLFGAIQPTGDIYRQARANGLDPQDAAAIGLFATLPVYLTEKIFDVDWLTKGLYKPVDKVWTKAMEDTFENYQKTGMINQLKNEIGQMKFVNKVFNKFQKGISKAGKLGEITKKGWNALPEVARIPKGIVEGGSKEFAQEYSEEMLNAFTEIAYDNIIASDKQPGQGAFGTTWEQTKERALTGGFMGMLVGGATGVFINGHEDISKDREQTVFSVIAEGAAKGGDKGAMDAYESLRNRTMDAYTNGEFSDQYLDPQGNPIDVNAPDNGFKAEIEVPGLKDGMVRTMADLNYYSMMMQLEEGLKLYKEAGFNDPDLINAVGQSDEFMVETMKNVKSQNEVKSKISTSEEKLLGLKDTDAEYTATQKEIELSQKELTTLKEDYNALTKPEEGTKYSKRVNDNVKAVRVRSQAARDVTNKYFQDKKGISVDKKFEETEEYRKQYIKNMRLMEDHYAASKHIDNIFNEHLDEIKKENEIKQSERDTSIEDINKLIETFTGKNITTDNFKSEVTKMTNDLNKITSGNLDFELAPEIKQSYQSAVESVNKRMSDTYHEASKKFGLEDESFQDIESARESFRDQSESLTDKINNPLDQGVYSIGDDITATSETNKDTRVEGVIMGVSEDSNFKSPEGIKYKVKLTNGEEKILGSNDLLKSQNLEVDENKEFHKFLIDNLYQQYNTLRILIKDQKGAGSRVEELQSMIDNIGNSIELFETGARAKNVLHNDEYSKEHMLKGERTLDTKTYESLLNGYAELKIATKELDDDLQKLTGANSTFSFRARQAHHRANSFSLLSMVENGFEKSFADIGISDLIKDLPDVKIVDTDVVITEEQKSESMFLEKRLNEIYDVIYRERDKIFKTSNIRDYLKKTFLVDKPKVFYQFSQEASGRTKYNVEDFANIRDKDAYSDPLYYISTVNLLMRMHGVNMNEFQNTRYSIFSDITKNVSSYEQQISEAQTVAFLNTGTELLEKIITIEKDYNKRTMSSEEIESAVGHFIKDSIMIQGWYGTGKTYQVLPNALKIYTELFGVELNTGIAGISQAIIDNVSNDLKKNHDIEALKLQDLNVSAILDGTTDLSKLDLIIWDEASFLSKENVLTLQQKLKDNNTKIIFLGDESQMIPVDSGEVKRWAAQVGIKTTPLTNIYRNDNPIIQGLAKWMIDGYTKNNRTDFLAQEDPIPSYWTEVDEQKRRHGVQFIANETGKYNKGIIKEFLSRGIDFDTVLIFVDHEQYQEALKDFPELGTSELSSRVKTLDWVNSKVEPGCVQGLGFDEVYVAIDFQNWKNNSSRIVQNDLAWAAAYTAISRAKKYVALPGPISAKYKSKPIFFKTTETKSTTKQDEQIQLVRSQRIEEEKVFIAGSIVSETFNPNEEATFTKKSSNTTNRKDNVANAKKSTKKQTIDEQLNPNEVINDSDWDIYDKRQDISDELLNTIADKVYNDSPLTIREREMANYFSSLIDEINSNINDEEVIKPKSKRKSKIKKAETKEEEVVVIDNQTQNYFPLGNAYVDKTTGELAYPTSYGTKGKYPVIKVNGVWVRIEDFNRRYDVASSSNLLTEDLNNITRFRASHDVMKKRNNTVAWGTTYTFVTDNLPSGKDVHEEALKKQVISHYLLNMSNIPKTLVYAKTGNLYEAKRPGKDLLLVKIKPDAITMARIIETFKGMIDKAKGIEKIALQEIIKSKTIPENYTYLMALADTEASYLLDGEKNVINAYTAPLNEIHKVIEQGFQDTTEGNTDIDDSNIKINQTLASLRHLGFQRSQTEGNYVELGVINDITDINQGVTIYGSGKKLLSDFKNTIQIDPLKSGIQFSDNLHQWVTTDGRVKLKLHYAYGSQPNAKSPYVVFNTPLLSESINSKSLSQNPVSLLNEDLKAISNKGWLNNYDDPKIFNEAISRLFVMKLLANNKSFINNNRKAQGLLKTFFKFESGYPNIDKNSIVGKVIREYFELQGKEIRGVVLEKEILGVFIDSFNHALAKENLDLSMYSAVPSYAQMNFEIKGIKNIVNEMKAKMNMPVDILRGTKTQFGRPVINNDLIYTNASDIHLPYAYVNIDGILDTNDTKNNNTDNSNTDSQVLKDILNGGSMPNFNKKTIISSATSRRISRNQSENIIAKILGNDFLNNNTEFKVNLVRGTSSLFGMMRNGKIALELNDKGIEYTTPRHEIFHVIFNYMLDDKTKSKLLNEVKNTLGREEMNDLAAEEWMARKAGKLTNEGLANKYSGKGLLQRFFKFLNNIYYKYVASTPMLNDLLNDIESGVYRNQAIIVEEQNIERHHDPNADDDYDDTSSIESNPIEGDIQNEDTDALVDYAKMPSIFGDYTGFVRKDIGNAFNEFSYYSTNPNISHTGTIDSYYRIFKELSTKNLENELTSFGKALKDVTKDDVNNRKLNGTDWANYKAYKLSNPKTFNAFVKDLFPSLNIKKLKVAKHTSAVHYDDSTFNPSELTGDHLKFQLEHTQLRSFKNNKLMNWDGKSFVSINEIMKIMSLAREKANIRFYNDTSQNYENTFIQELKHLADKAGIGSYRSNHVHSFLAKFFESYSTENSQENHLSMRDLVSVLRNQDENIIANKNRVIAVQGLLNHIGNVNKSLYMKNVSFVEYKRGVNKYISSDNASYARVKGEIVAGMKSNMFRESLIKESKLKQIDPNNKNNLFTIEKDGLYWSKNGQRSQIISVGKNGVALTDKFDLEHMSSIKSFFGLKNIKDRVFVALMDNYDGVNQMLEDTTRNDMKFQTDNKGSEFLARGLMAMFYSTQVNSDMTDAITELNKMYLPDDDRLKIAEGEVISGTRSKSPSHELMLSLYRGLGVDVNNLDDLFESFADENEETSEGYAMPKPFDVYPFLNALAEVEIYYRGSEEINFFFRPDGKKEYLHQLHSHLTRTLHYGSQNLVIEFNKQFAMDPNAMINSPFLDENSKSLYKIIDENNPMVIKTVRDFSGIKAMRGTTNPNMTDVTTMIMTSFLDSVIKTSKSDKTVQRLNMSLNNISDKEKLFNAEVEFNSTGEKLFTVDVDNNGKIKSVNINYKNIYGDIRRKFQQLQRIQQVSRNNWAEFIQTTLANSELGNKSFIKLLAKSNKAMWELGSLEDISKLNRVFESSFTSLSEEDKVMFVEALEKSDLFANRDYYLSKDKKVVRFGNAINVNSNDENESVYTATNMYDILSQNPNAIEHEKELDKIFNNNFNTNEYRKYSKKMYESRYQVPEDIAALLPGTSPVYDMFENKFNPFFKAHFFANEIFQNELTPFLNGLDGDYINAAERSKRTAPLVTGTTTMATNVAYGLGANLKMILINDHYVKSRLFGGNIVAADGQMIGNPLFYSHQLVSIGGFENATIGEGMQKTLLNQLDYKTGNLTQIKHANLIVTTEIYKNNPMHRMMVADMLNANTRGAKTDITKNRAIERLDINQEQLLNFDIETEMLLDFNLEEMFNTYYAVTRNVEEASNMLRDWIEEVSESTKEIKDNIVWGMQYKSGSKGSSNRINNYDLDNRLTTDEDFALTDIQTNKIGLVLNPNQDIEKYKNVAPMNQILSFIGYGSDENAQQAHRTYDAFRKIYDIENAAVKTDIEKDFDKFMRDKGLLSLRQSGFVGSLAEALNDSTISIQIPAFRTKLIQVFRNYLTDRIMRQKMFGIRVTQASGHGFLMFEHKSGGIYTMSQVEERENVEFDSLEMMAAINQDTSWGDYSIRGLKAMRLEDGEMKSAEVGVSFSHFKKFGLTAGEQVSDVLTIKFLDERESVVLPSNITHEQLDIFLQENGEFIDEENTIAARLYFNKNNTADQNGEFPAFSVSEMVNEMAIYLKGFTKMLEMYTTRVPSSRLGSGALVTPTFFIQDSANVMFIPLELTELNDSDFDIDQLALYQYSINDNLDITNSNINSSYNEMQKYEELHDFILDNVRSIYTNPNNAQDILFPSTLEKLRNVATDLSKVNKEEINALTKLEQFWLNKSEGYKYNRKNSFSTMMDEYETNASGNDAIGILARSLSAVSYLGQVRGNNFDKIAPGFKNMKTLLDNRGLDSIIVRLGDYLQAALDNAKELILGNMGITTYATPLIAPMIMDEWSNVKIKAFFSHPIVTKVLNTVAQGDSVQNKKSDYQLHDIIAIERKGLTKLSDDVKLKAIEKLKELQKTDPNSSEYAETYTMLHRSESMEYLDKLEDYANKAAALRRFGDVVSTRNGLQVNDFEFEKAITSFQQSLGMNFQDFFSKDRAVNQWSIEKHLKYFRENNDEYRAAVQSDKSKESGANIVDGVLEYGEMATRIKNGKVAFAKILENQKHISLDKEKGKYIDSRGMEYTRLSDWLGLKPEVPTDLMKTGSNIGNHMDVAMRDFFRFREKGDVNYGETFKAKYNNYDGFSGKDVYDKYIDQLQKFAQWLDRRNETPYASTPDSGDNPKGIILHYPDLKVAGEVDLITINDAGELSIYDLKSLRKGEKETADADYETEYRGEPSRKTKHQAQLNGYRALMLYNYGIDVKNLWVMPVEVNYEIDDTKTPIANILEFKKVEKLSEEKLAKLMRIKEIKLIKKSLEKGDKLKDILEAREKSIAEKLNINELVKQFPHFKSYINLYHEENERTQEKWIYDNVNLKKIGEEYLLKTLGKTSWDFKNRRTTFYNSVSKALVGFHLSTHENYSGNIYDIDIPIELADGSFARAGRSLQTLQLNTAKGRTLFKKQFPAYITFIKDTINEHGPNAINIFKQNGMDVLTEDFDNIIDNAFLERIQSYPRYNRDTLILRESISINEHEIQRLKNSFSQLPSKLQEMFAINDFINYTFQYRNGTISDIIGLKFYRELSSTMNKFKGVLENGEGIDYLRALGSGIISHTQHSKNGTPFYSKKVHKARGEVRPELVLKRVKIREGLYAYKHIRFEPIDDQYYDDNAEYIISEEIETDKNTITNSDFQFVTTTPTIKVFTSAELSDLAKDEFVDVTFRKGHNYKENDIYINELGLQVRVHDVSSDFTTVTFKAINSSSFFDKISATKTKKVQKAKQTDIHFSLDNVSEIEKYDEGKHIEKSSTISVATHLEQISGIPFIGETNASIIKKYGKGINARGWVDQSGVHYNIDAIKDTDFMHELSHIWYKAIQKRDPELWNTLVDEATSIIDNNHIIHQAVQSKLRSNNMTLSRADLIEEVIATIAGLSSKNAVDAFLSGNDITKTTEPGFVERVWNGLKSLANKISQFFKNHIMRNPNHYYDDSFPEHDVLANIRMADMFKDMAQSVLNGNITPELSQLLIDGYKGFNDFNIGNEVLKAEKILIEALGKDFTHTNKDIVIENAMIAQSATNVSIVIENVFDDKGEIAYKARIIQDNLKFSVGIAGIVNDDISEMMPLFNNNSTPQKSLSKVSNDRLATAITNSMIQRGTQSKTKNQAEYRYNLGGKPFIYPKTFSFSKLKAAVEMDIIPQFHKFETELKPNLKAFAQAILNNDGKSITEIGASIFGKKKFSDATLNQIASVIGLDEGFEEIYNYSELADQLNDPSLKALYSKSFVGFDPIVVVHSRDVNGVFDISILDITSKPLERNSKDLSQRGLQSTKEYSFDYYFKGGRFDNHDRDIRKFLLGLTALSMAKNSRKGDSKKSNVKIRNIGVVQLMGNNVRKHMISNIADVVNEVKLVADNDKYMRNITNEEIISVMKDPFVYEHPMQQSYMSRLKVFLQYLIDSDGTSYAKRNVFQTQLSILNDPKSDKSQLISVIESRKAFLDANMEQDDAFKNGEYQMLSETLKELQTGFVGRINEIKSMREYEMLINTAHDISDDNLQWLVTTVTTTKNIVVEEMYKAQMKMKDDFKKVIEAYEVKHPETKTTKFTKDIGSKYFEHLFKTKSVVHDGNTVDVLLPELHWNPEHDDTARLMKDGKLTKNDLDFTNKLLDIIEDRWLKNRLHSDKRTDAHKEIDGISKLTIEDIKPGFYDNENYVRGMIPMIGKSANELLFSGKFKSAGARIGDVLGNFEVLFEDDNLGTSMNAVSNALSGQYDIIQRYAKIGLDYTEGDVIGTNEVTIRDYDANTNTSTNLEAIYNYFMLAGIRQQRYEEKVIPVYNSVKSILTMYKNAVDTPQKSAYMRYNLQWADEYINRVIHRQSGETPNDLTIPKVKFKRQYNKDGSIKAEEWNLPNQVDMNKLGRGLVSATSFATLGYSTGVAFKSLLFNELAGFINGIAATISGANEGNGALPGLGEVHEAHKIVLGGGETNDFKKARRLALDFQLINRNERDMLENPFLNLTNKNIFQKAYAHLLNWGTDAAARMIAMVAIMKKDGTWDAYHYDEKTGDVIYTETKDKRFYDADGKQKTAKGEHAIKEYIRQKLIEQGSQSNTEMGLTKGYDFELIEGTMKWYADKYIIGTMDETSKPIIGNRFIGAAMSNFKVFSFSRLFNAGVFAETRQTTKGTGYKAYKDEDGTWIAEKDLLEIEGALQSFAKVMNAFKNTGNESLDEWWKNADDITKFNIWKTMVQMALWGLIYGLVNGAWDKEKFEWLYKDIFIGPTVSNVLTDSPFPTYNIVSQFVSSAIGGDIEGIGKTFGLTRNVIKGVKNFNYITE